MLSLLRTLAMGFTTLAMAVPAIVAASFDRGGPRSSAVVVAWARAVLWLGGVHVEVEGGERLPAEGGQVYVATHQSALDIPALFTVVPPRTRFVAKRELFRIPVFGFAIKLLGFIPIDRWDPRAAAASMDRAGRLGRENRPVLVFPEGSRSPDDRLLPFKKGAFALAHRFDLPVVPLACLGGRERLAAGSLRVSPGRMVIRVGRPLVPGTPAYRTRVTLLEATRSEIEELISVGVPSASTS